MKLHKTLFFSASVAALLCLGGCPSNANDDDSTANDDDAADDDDATDDDDSAAGDDDDATDDDDSAPGDDDDSAPGDDDDSAAGDDDDAAPVELTCPDNDMYEPNDTPAAVHALGNLPVGTSTFEGILCPANTNGTGVDDVDWFGFAGAVVASCYDISVDSGAPAGVDVEITNANGSNTFLSGTTTPNVPVELNNQPLPNVAHKVGMSRSGAPNSLNRRFTLSITVKMAGDCP